MTSARAGIGDGVVATGLALALLAAPAAGGGDFHRWVDPEGDVHYTDAPPPDSVRNASAEPDPQAGAREREARAAAQRAETEAAAQETARRDRMLLQSYTTIAEIERTRDRRLEGVAGKIGLARHRVRRARERIAQYDDELAKQGEEHEHRAAMQRQRREVVERLERRREELARLRDKRAGIEARFARDIERFRELQAETGAD